MIRKMKKRASLELLRGRIERFDGVVVAYLRSASRYSAPSLRIGEELFVTMDNRSKQSYYSFPSIHHAVGSTSTMRPTRADVGWGSM